MHKYPHRHNGQPWVRTSRGKTADRPLYHGKRVVLHRGCRQRPSEEAVVVFKLEVIRLELGSDGANERNRWMWKILCRKSRRRSSSHPVRGSMLW